MFQHRHGLFFSRWLRRPLRTGAVVPSGGSLARLMAAQVDPAAAGAVVELGGGTGAITAALLAAGIGPERLLVVEQDEALHRLLIQRFPGLRVLHGDAGELPALLRRQGIEQAATAVSSLPLLAMSDRRRRELLGAIFACLAPDGELVQFTYGPHAPIGNGELPPWRLSASAAGRCWRNIPPATVWRIRHHAAANAAPAA